MKSILSCLALTFCLTATVQDAAAVGVRGASSCGMWVKERTQKNASRFEEIWLLGFLSGLAVGEQKEFWTGHDGNKLDNDSVFLWVDNYCRANPLKSLTHAGYDLFLERTQKAPKR